LKEVVHCLDVLGLDLVKIIKLGELDIKLALLEVCLDNTSNFGIKNDMAKNMYK